MSKNNLDEVRREGDLVCESSFKTNLANFNSESSNVCQKNINIEEVEATNLNKRQNLIEAIQNIVVNIVCDLASNNKPSIIVRNQRYWHNCIFQDILKLKQGDSAALLEIKFSSSRINRDFTQIIFLLGKIYQLLVQNSASSRREVYYENLDLFADQSQIDSAADRVSCLLGVPQWEVGLFASTKGIIAGALKIISSSFYIDCSIQKGGTLIPSDLPVGVKMVSDAKFLLVVEKDSAFQKLYDEGFLDHHGPCIMVTGKGYPDISTRVLVKYIWEQLALPIFILVDSDPYGIEIMCIYKFGSLKQSHIGHKLAVPSAKWIGIHPTDMEDLNVQSKKLSSRDIRKVHCLLSRPYINENKNIRDQLNFLSDSGKKSEIEGIVQISQGYLTDVYIPLKMTSKNFL